MSQPIPHEQESLAEGRARDSRSVRRSATFIVGVVALLNIVCISLQVAAGSDYHRVGAIWFFELAANATILVASLAGLACLPAGASGDARASYVIAGVICPLSAALVDLVATFLLGAPRC